MLGVKQKEAIITKTMENLLLHFISGVILKIRWSLKNKFINIENRFDIRGFQIALEKYIQENIYLWGFPYLNNIRNMRQSNACHSTELIIIFSSKIQIKSCSGIIKTKKTALVNKRQGLLSKHRIWHCSLECHTWIQLWKTWICFISEVIAQSRHLKSSNHASTMLNYKSQTKRWFEFLDLLILFAASALFGSRLINFGTIFCTNVC
jgi:hypothetical protein